jgi:hypothetical protein
VIILEFDQWIRELLLDFNWFLFFVEFIVFQTLADTFVSFQTMMRGGKGCYESYMKSYYYV